MFDFIEKLIPTGVQEAEYSEPVELIESDEEVEEPSGPEWDAEAHGTSADVWEGVAFYEDGGTE